MDTLRCSSTLPRGFRALAAMLCSLLAISGCGPDPASPSQAIPALTVGDSFTFDGYDLDTNGARRPDSRSTTTFVVRSVGASYFGRTGVTILGRENRPTDTIAILHDQNGDLTVLSEGYNASLSGTQELRSPALWATLPYGSKNTKRDTVRRFDTSTTVDNDTWTFSIIESVEYVGADRLSVGAETLSAEKVIVRRHWAEISADRTLTLDHVWTYWYSSSIGYIVRIDGHEFDNTGGNDRWESVLTAYTRN